MTRILDERTVSGGLVLAVALLGCDRITGLKEELFGAAEAEAAAADPQAALAAPYALTCPDVPGAPRSGLVQGADGELYFVERRPVEPTEDFHRFDLYRFEPASGERARVLERIDPDFRVLSDGGIVFTRQAAKHEYLPQHFVELLVQKPGQGAALRLNGEKQGFGGFEVFEDDGVVVYAGGDDAFADEIMKVSLDGGESKKLGRGYQVVAALDASSVIVHAGLGLFQKQAIAGGEATQLFARQEGVVGVFGERIVERTNGRYFSSTASDPARTPLAEGLSRPRLVARGRHFTLSGREGDVHVALNDDGPGTKAVLRTTGAQPTAVIEHEGALVVLATHDTNGDGAFDFDDESDLCVVRDRADPEAAVEIPTRTLPASRLQLADRLAAIGSDHGLPRARVRIIGDGPDTVVVLHTLVEAPKDPAALRESVRTVGKAVNAALGEPVSVSLRWHGNGRRADWSWDPDTEAFTAHAGIGTASTADAADYAVSFDPAVETRVKSEYGRTSPIGEATCKGTVTNVGTEPLSDLEVTCSSDVITGLQSATAKVQPPTLAPGAVGKYSVRIPIADTSKPFPLLFRAGGRQRVALNLFAQARQAESLAFFDTLLDRTGLSFERQHAYERGPSYAREQVREVTLRVPMDFASRSAADQQRSAEAARDALVGHWPGAAIELVLLEHASERPGWRMAPGQALAGFE